MKGPVFWQQPSISEALTRAGGVEGQPPGGFLQADLVPVVQALDLSDQQYARLEGIGTFAAAGLTPNAAGERAIATVQNPAGSGRIFRIREVVVASQQGALRYGVLSGPAVPAILNNVALLAGIRDSRVIQAGPGTAATSAAVVELGTTLAGLAAGAMVFSSAAGDVQARFDPLCTVAPGGWFFVIQPDVLGGAFEVSFAWDERIPTTAELSYPNVF